MEIITQVNAEKGVGINMLCDALTIPRATYYRALRGDENNLVTKAKATPKNALDAQEISLLLDLLHSERFMDKTPYEVYHTLLDEGKYFCSPRTMYRILTTQGENKERRIQRAHRDAIKPELMATRPNEVWSWDITKLLCTKKLVYFYLYVILDIYSRYVVGWLIADCELKEHACKLIKATAIKQGILPDKLTLHADNGASMISHSVANLLDNLGIMRTHNRPYTSNDNPFSESQFKTLKYSPKYPGRFESMQESEDFCFEFLNWYNAEHFHSGIEWLTPETVHYGQAENILKKRHQVLMEAYKTNPIRFNNKAPKLKELPEAVFINPPQTVQISALLREVIMF